MMNVERRTPKHAVESTYSAGADIRQRAFQFATRIIKLVRVLPRDVAGSVISRQLARAGMSIGANLEEAQAAQTRKEFQRKINIAKSEAREALYWLRLLVESEMIAEHRIDNLITEADELLRIITTILLNSRKNDELRA